MSNQINNRSDLNEWISYELRRYPVGFFNRLFSITEMAILRKHQILLRKTEFYYNTNHHILYHIYRIRLFRIQNKYLMRIPINTCGKGLYLPHLGSRLINGSAKLGRDCILHVNTCIVAGGIGNGVPSIGNNVALGVGAVVLGDIHVADGVAIGANAVVNRSVEENNITVAGVPAKKISNHSREDWDK